MDTPRFGLRVDFTHAMLGNPCPRLLRVRAVYSIQPQGLRTGTVLNPIVRPINCAPSPALRIPAAGGGLIMMAESRLCLVPVELTRHGLAAQPQAQEPEEWKQHGVGLFNPRDRTGGGTK